MGTADTFTSPSFSLQNRVARVAWNAVYLIFFRFSPAPFHSWRAWLLRCFGARLGKGVHVYPRARIWAPWNLELKDQCGIANDVTLYSQGRITIGRRAIVSQGSYICTGTHDYTHFNHPLVTAPIVIGDFAWVAAQAFVHPGVNIGEGCVIGARSVVVSDMPSWSICAGHPCRMLKARVMVQHDEINPSK